MFDVNRGGFSGANNKKGLSGRYCKISKSFLCNCFSSLKWSPWIGIEFLILGDVSNDDALIFEVGFDGLNDILKRHVLFSIVILNTHIALRSRFKICHSIEVSSGKLEEIALTANVTL